MSQNIETGGVPLYRDASQAIDKRVEDLLSRMTLEEKVGQLRSDIAGRDHYLRSEPEGTPEPGDLLKEVLSGPSLGKLALLLRADPFSGIAVEQALTPSEGAELTNAVQRHALEHTRLGIPILIGSDGNHGHFGAYATILPALCTMGCTWNEELVREAAHVIAVESRSRGETVIYAPDLDVVRDPRYGRSDQNFGEDPYLVGRLGVAMVKGLQGDDLTNRDSVVALLRAYPGCGDTDGGHDFGQTSRGPIELHEVVLRPWGWAVAAGAEAVMIEFAVFDGVPISRSSYLMSELLREKWGFRGFTMGDSHAVGYLIYCRTASDQKEASAIALKAGLDMSLPDSAIEALAEGKSDRVSYGTLPEAVAAGLVSEGYVDRAVRRILRVKFLLGLFDAPLVDPSYADTVARRPEHGAVALQAAREGIVLLENRGILLPLGAGASLPRSIAVVGPNAHDHWAQLGDYAAAHFPEDVVTILDGIKARAGDIAVRYARGCGIRSLSTDGFAEALTAAEQSDLVVAVVGGSSKGEYIEKNGRVEGVRSDESDCGESTDRATLDLLGVQLDLLKALKATGKPLVVVLIHGRAMSIPWIAENADALIDAGYPGQAGGTAVAEVLFGDYCPGGRLTVSVPKHVGQLPIYYYSRFPDRGRYVEMDTEPLYPFGYGLSYTSFTYGALEVSPAAISADQTARVSVTVENSGSCRGDEVVQLYIRDDISSVMRPWKQLKAFRRLSLSPGEKQLVTFDIGFDELCFYSESGEWVVEPGTFTLMVGRDAKNDIATTQLTLVSGGTRGTDFR